MKHHEITYGSIDAELTGGGTIFANNNITDNIINTQEAAATSVS
jgi:hypothetical protein